MSQMPTPWARPLTIYYERCSVLFTPTLYAGFVKHPKKRNNKAEKVQIFGREKYGPKLWNVVDKSSQKIPWAWTRAEIYLPCEKVETFHLGLILLKYDTRTKYVCVGDSHQKTSYAATVLELVHLLVLLPHPRSRNRIIYIHTRYQGRSARLSVLPFVRVLCSV